MLSLRQTSFFRANYFKKLFNTQRTDIQIPRIFQVSKLRIGAHEAAQTNAQRFRMLIIAHGERDLQIFVRVQAIRVNKMAGAQGAGVAENAHYFIVGGEQVHRVARWVAIQRIDDVKADLLREGGAVG